MQESNYLQPQVGVLFFKRYICMLALCFILAYVDY